MSQLDIDGNPEKGVFPLTLTKNDTGDIAITTLYDGEAIISQRNLNELLTSIVKVKNGS